MAPTGPRWSSCCRTWVRLSDSWMMSWRATVIPPGERCTQVHDEPGVSSVTSQTSFGIRGCLISNRLPTASPGPSSATSRVTDAVHSGQRSTSLNTSQTTPAGASISTPLSVIMYQMVHDYFWRADTETCQSGANRTFLRLLAGDRNHPSGSEPPVGCASGQRLGQLTGRPAGGVDQDGQTRVGR